MKDHDLFLPMLAIGPRPVQPPDETTHTGDFAGDLFHLMRKDADQQRCDVLGHIVLYKVAQYRAGDMVGRGYFSHVDPEGFGPNYFVRRFGYKLPDWYSDAPDANNVESIASEALDPASLWALFMGSEPHREHLLGENAFYKAQVYVGIGVAVQPSGRYMVSVISAPKGV